MWEDATYGEWRRHVAERRRNVAWLLAHFAMVRAWDALAGRQLVRPSDRDVLISDACDWAMDHPDAETPPETPLSEWMADVILRVSRSRRRRRRRALGLPLTEARIGSLGFEKDDSDESDGPVPAVTDFNVLTIAESAAAKAYVDADGNISEAARLLGISRGAARSRIESLKRRLLERTPCPQPMDRSWASRAAELAESEGERDAAALLREYARGAPYADLAARLGRSEGALRESVSYWKRRLKRDGLGA